MDPAGEGGNGTLKHTRVEARSKRRKRIRLRKKAVSNRLATNGG